MRCRNTPPFAARLGSFLTRGGLLGLAAASLAMAGCEPGSGEAFSIERTSDRELHVVDGQPANSGQLNSTVALAQPGGYPFCTGTLVHPRVVVSAAHCVEGTSASQVEIVAGALNANFAPNSQRYDVAQVIGHPSYGGFGGGTDSYGVGNTNDISVLILSGDVTSLPATPILPAASFDAWVPGGTSVVVTGYGTTSVNGGNSGVLYIGETPYSHRSESEFLAGGVGYTDTCYGDSGGPVYAYNGDTRYLIGATSRAAWGTNLECGGGGIYTLVPAFAGWIDDVSGGLVSGGSPGDGDGDGDGGGGQCAGACGGQSSAGCWCDDLCTGNGDCCADYADTCIAPGDGDGDAAGDGDGDGDGGEWTCPQSWIGDSECDCGCGAPDVDCTSGTVEECEWDHCGDGLELVPSDPSICSAPGGDGDGDGDVGGGQCAGACGGQSPAGCWCDDLCTGNGDCCADYGDTCVETEGGDGDGDVGDGDGDTGDGDTGDGDTGDGDGDSGDGDSGDGDGDSGDGDGDSGDGDSGDGDGDSGDGDSGDGDGDSGDGDSGDGDGDSGDGDSGDGDGDSGDGDSGDGDGDSGDGDGDAAADGPPAGWTCDSDVFLNGVCDCGCGAQDKDCVAGDVDHCEVDHCPSGTVPGTLDATQCVEPAGTGGGGEDEIGPPVMLNRNDEPSDPALDERSETHGGCSETGASPTYAMGLLGLGLFAARRRRRRGCTGSVS